MVDINRPNSSAWAYTWAFALGFVGFICGYFGQALLLAAQSDAAPLFGIVVSGPTALFLGVMLGAWSTRLRLSNIQNLVFLLIAIIAVAVGTLYLAVSDYRETIRLVDAEIIGCERVDQLLSSKSDMWSEVVDRAIKERQRDARPNWRQEIPDMLRAQPGAVLTMRIYQEARVREQKWRWGGVSQKVDNWKSTNETQQVFAAIADPVPLSPCERFVIGDRRFSALVYERSYGTPPATLPAFLWLYVFQQVPPEYVRYIPK